MANEIALLPQGFGKLSTVLAPSAEAASEFGAGIVAGFPVLGFRGKVWRLKYRGEEMPLLDENEDPLPSVELILIRAAPHLSKSFYANGYEQGSNNPPDCWSSNGKTPDATVTEPCAQVCALCPYDEFGSGTNGKGKACADVKRLAVTVLGDIENETYGGPMLLRVPAASLGELATYETKMKGFGFPLFAIGTRVRFDPNSEFPKLLFKEIRALGDDESVHIASLREDPRVLRIINEMEHVAQGEPAAAGPQFEQETPKPAAAPVARPAAAAARPAPARPAGVAKPAAAPVVAPATTPQAAPKAASARPGAKLGGISQAMAAPEKVAAPSSEGKPAKPAGVRINLAAAKAAPAADPEMTVALSRDEINQAITEHEEANGSALPGDFQSALDATLEGLI